MLHPAPPACRPPAGGAEGLPGREVWGRDKGEPSSNGGRLGFRGAARLSFQVLNYPGGLERAPEVHLGEIEEEIVVSSPPENQGPGGSLL